MSRSYCPVSNFIQADPNQPLLLPVDLSERVVEDDRVHSVPERVAQKARTQARI